ncbi:MAG: hypothetical protein JSV18_01505, partial [Candidatus Bathyarchaeota archaeon]
RSDAAIVYDPRNDIVILHDGYCRDDSHPQDTWVFDFDSINWNQMNPEESPLPQYGHHMVFDTRNRMAIMYGGHWSITGTSRHGYSDGVWTYDYPSDSWTKVDTATSLPSRYWHTLAYDEDRGNMIVFGGSGMRDAILDDTWLYDLSTNTWERLYTDEKPSGRENSALVYDPVHEKFILFGGLREIGEPPLNDLWVLDIAEGTWREVFSEPVSTDGEDDEPSQTGIPGFPLPSIILSMALIMILLAGGRNSSNGVISAQAGWRARVQITLPAFSRIHGNARDIW